MNTSRNDKKYQPFIIVPALNLSSFNICAIDIVYNLTEKTAGHIYFNKKYEIQRELSFKINYFT